MTTPRPRFPSTVTAAELAPGLWRWASRHPEWHPGEFGAEVASFALEADMEDRLLVGARLADRRSESWPPTARRYCTTPSRRWRRRCGSRPGASSATADSPSPTSRRWAQAERFPEIRRELAACYEDGRRALAAMIEERLDTVGADARALAAAIFACFDGLLIQWLLDPRRTQTGSEVLAAVETAARAMADSDHRRSMARASG